MMLDELIEKADQTRQEQGHYPHQFHVCSATPCLAAGSEHVRASLLELLKERGLSDRCLVKNVGCLGLCTAGPLVSVEPDGVLYQHVADTDVTDLVASLGASPVDRLRAQTEIPFFQRQHRIVLEHCGQIDSEHIEDYLALGGYQTLLRVLEGRTPQQVIEEITRSGLRGRGGAGFPTGLKWQTVAKARGPRKYVIGNGDEGDPGAFMDRSVMESDPHRVLEGIAIAAYAVGASHGYFYVRAEYPLAVKRLNHAIRLAKQAGLLGEHIGGSSFSFDAEVRLGAGAYVCGEETALIASTEGRRGQPRPRPPYPAEVGLWGGPTLINNVETLANIVPILRDGADRFASVGTEKSKGTKIFALSGQVSHTGLIEVPMGITLREIVFDIGGGIPNGRRFKAVQTGGPSGGCIPESLLDTPVDYESLTKLGTIMGSGGMIVMDETSSMVEVARYFMEFSKTESCGKCIPCRVGTVHLWDILDKVARGAATPGDLAQLEELCDMVRSTSLCGLGQGAPSPVLSTLRYFRDEYEARIAAPIG
jgi:bidirectional [NiFe] hydrogenase diaphorase subunit